MINRGEFAPGQILVAALSTWLVFFLSSLVGAAISTGAFGIPLGRVVDVLLSLQLAVLALFVFAVVIAVLGELSTGRVTLSFLSGLAAILVCSLQPFAAIAGYRLYGAIATRDFVDASHVYLPLMQLYAATLAGVGLLPQRMLADPMVLGLAPADPAGWSKLTHAMVQVENGLIASSLVFSLLATLLCRMRTRQRVAWQ